MVFLRALLSVRTWEWIFLFGLVAMGVTALFLPDDMGNDVDTTAEDRCDEEDPPLWACLSGDHPLGIDWLGRDMLTRIVISTKGFFLPGILAALLAVIIGVPLGAFAGYTPPGGGWRRRSRWLVAVLGVTRRTVALVLTIPGTMPRFVTVFLVCAALGFDPFLMASAAGVLYAAELGEDVHQRVRSCSQEEYVEAGIAHGLSPWWILSYHLLWLQCRFLVMRHVVHLWTFVILLEVSLSYLGFGIQEPTPSWGNILKEVSQEMGARPWPAAVATLVTVGSLLVLSRLADRLGEMALSGASTSADVVEPPSEEPALPVAEAEERADA